MFVVLIINHDPTRIKPGSPYFYQSTTLDPTGIYALNDSRASFTLTEYVLGCCNDPTTADPQYPECPKITLSEKLTILKTNSKEGRNAEAALIARHPQFAGFPKAKKFSVFKLLIDDIFLVNKLAPRRPLTVEEYLASDRL